MGRPVSHYLRLHTMGNLLRRITEKVEFYNNPIETVLRGKKLKN
jgi:hypothetical protein